MVHNDPTPSLNVEMKAGEVVWRCHGGCEQKAVLAALLEETARAAAAAERAQPDPDDNRTGGQLSLSVRRTTP